MQVAFEPMNGVPSNSVSLRIDYYQCWEVINIQKDKSVCKSRDLGGETVLHFT